jgi:hypothetical protein
VSVSIICPTVDGREESLARARQSYAEHTLAPFEWIVVRNRPTCGIAWNEGLELATGDLVHFTADDVEAVTPGWDRICEEWFARSTLPAPRILNTDGTLQSCGDDATERDTGTHTELTRIPTIPRELVPVVAPIIETHYYTDSWVSYQAARVGWRTVVVRELVFAHHFAQAGRLDERLYPDYHAFVAARDAHPLPA